MKLESLKSSKFEAFKNDELTSLVYIVGGYKCWDSKNGAGEVNDSYNDSTSSKDQPVKHTIGGVYVDKVNQGCMIGPSESLMVIPVQTDAGGVITLHDAYLVEGSEEPHGDW